MRTLLSYNVNYSFGASENMETQFEELNLLIKEHDELSGNDDVLGTIKWPILVARACETSERICSLTVAILKQERFSRSKNDDDRVEQKHANAAEGKDKSENNRQGKGKNFVKKKGHLSNKEKVHPKERHTTSSKARAEKVDKLDI